MCRRPAGFTRLGYLQGDGQHYRTLTREASGNIGCLP